MKKHSLLMLLPLGLAITACSGNLSKGNIFNEKFMKANFGERIQKSYQFVAPQKVDLAVGEDVSQFNEAAGDNDLVFIKKTDGKTGYFSVIENKYVLPLDEYHESGSSIKKANGFSLRFPYNYKVVDDVKTNYLFDEYGNKIYEGNGEGITLAKKDLTVEAGSDLATRITVYKLIEGDQIPAAYAYYTVDAKLKEVISPEEFFKRNAHSLSDSTESLSAYGHPELVHTYVTSGSVIRCRTVDVKKNKIVASYTVPSGATFFRAGDYWFYQVETAVHARENKYEYLDGTNKKNVETYRVNYLTGKTSSVKTDIVFSKTTTRTSIKDKNGENTLIYLGGAKEILKDKTLSKNPRNIILNQKFKEVADVSGIDFLNLKPFGNYWTNNRIVYDSKMKEVAYLSYADGGLNPRIGVVNVGQGLVDNTGKFIVSPEWNIQETGMDNIFYAGNSTNGKVFKIENEKATELSNLDLTKYAITDGTGSGSHIIVTENETSKVFVYDLMSGTMSDPVAPGDYDTSYNINLFEKREGTLTYRATVYTHGTSRFAIFAATNVTKSYAPTK